MQTSSNGVLALCLTLGSLVSSAFAQDAFQLLHSFTFGEDGAHPSAALNVKPDGSVLCGTAEGGGEYGHGNVFCLVRKNQTWQGAVLHSFGPDMDGWYPDSSLVYDAIGNMYGTTSEGGPYGFGTVFELAPMMNGKWSERVLHAFSLYTEDTPTAPVAFDLQGNLYGTTQLGGLGWGAVFEMMPPGSPGGQWTESVLYDFTDSDDGAFPQSGLLVDGSGNLFGTSYYAGIQDSGTVYELKHSAGGWSEDTLYEFTRGNDGANPSGPLICDKKGNLYGTAEIAGVGEYGVVFKLSYSGGAWDESVLFSFDNGADGGHPENGLTFDPLGNLYGTTRDGGAYGYGTVFKLSPKSDGTWSETVLYSFTDGQHGANPQWGVVPDRFGRLYGVTSQGGIPCNCGTVFELIPPTYEPDVTR